MSPIRHHTGFTPEKELPARIQGNDPQIAEDGRNQILRFLDPDKVA
jgi:hypothetical protein